jgi:hypothetical protein
MRMRIGIMIEIDLMATHLISAESTSKIGPHRVRSKDFGRWIVSIPLKPSCQRRVITRE